MNIVEAVIDKGDFDEPQQVLGKKEGHNGHEDKSKDAFQQSPAKLLQMGQKRHRGAAAIFLFFVAVCHRFQICRKSAYLSNSNYCLR